MSVPLTIASIVFLFLGIYLIAQTLESLAAMTKKILLPSVAIALLLILLRLQYGITGQSLLYTIGRLPQVFTELWKN